MEVVGLTLAIGSGLTVIVKVIGFPLQGLLIGVTVMVAVIGFGVLFVAVKEFIFPLPEAANPIAVLSFVQE
jgi:hypothetical protein